jgi:RimJ/RimL family protein N-acetyltransferase
MRAVPAGQNTQMVADYIASKVPGAGLRFAPGQFQAFAFLSDTDEFMGGCVIANFRQGPYGNDCEISCAAENSMAFRHNVVHAVMDYVFGQLLCTRLTAITTKRNSRTRAFLEALGFALEGNIRRAYDGKRDALIYGLMVEDCRFLGAGGLNGEIDTAGTDTA